MTDSIMIILEAVPNTINLNILTEELSCIEGVRSVHNLNVWSLTVGWNMMSAHIIIGEREILGKIYTSSNILIDIFRLICQRRRNTNCSDHFGAEGIRYQTFNHSDRTNTSAEYESRYYLAIHFLYLYFSYGKLIKHSIVNT